jgi:SM-20-related protein
MTGALALESLGLFVRPSFLDEAECARFVEAMRTGPRVKGRVATDDAEHVDENVRRVWCTDPGRESVRAVYDAFCEVKPELESHFHRPLDDLDGPDFLVYEAGAHYTPHRDVGPHNEGRAISAVVFLNGPGTGDGDGYVGGTLTLYGLLDGPEWTNFPVRVTAHPGLLVAFPSDTVHEVTPVSSGRRCTVVGWFKARQ